MIELPQCPNEGEAPRHSWILSAANICAHHDIPKQQAITLIRSKLTREPSPHNEIDTTVEKAYAEAASRPNFRNGASHYTPAIPAINESERAAIAREQKRKNWPVFETPSQAQITIVAESLCVSCDAVTLASMRGLLYCAKSKEGDLGWIVCDHERRTAIARRLDGKSWQNGKLERFLPGSEQGWPVGLSKGNCAIALALGMSGLIYAAHLLWCADLEGAVTPVAMLNVDHPITQDALDFFAGRRVCLLEEDASRFAGQLLSVNADVTIFNFDGYLRDDSQRVESLKDFVRLEPDMWGPARADVESAFFSS